MTSAAVPRPAVVILGGGYSGAAVAYHLARRESFLADILVVEPRPRLGGGLAYSSPDPSHRVNVPARRMSLSTDEPDGFARWLAETGAAKEDAGVVALGDELFPQRALFGRYIGDQLEPFLKSGRIRHVEARAVAAERIATGFRVRLDDGRTVEGDALVLAVTHPPPSIPGPLRVVASHAGFHANPYDVAALDTVGQEARVLIVGTGLTMADMVASLDRRGHRGEIVALSRHGWRSRGHAPGAPDTFGDFRSDPARTVSALFRRVRIALAEAAEAGLPWQSVFDTLRQQGPEIWNALSPPERARLLRHGRTLWDVHRFRIAPQVEAVLDARLADGRLRILAASLPDARIEGDEIAVTIRRRHRKVTETLRFDHVIVTTGPGHGDATRTDSMLASLVSRGDLEADGLGLGLAVDRDSRAIGASGRPGERLFVAGPLGRATFGELMGLPEVTASAERVAEGVARLIEADEDETGQVSTRVRQAAGA